MPRVRRDDLPTEGIHIVGIGHFKPGQDVDVSEDAARILKSKGFIVTQIRARDKGGIGNAMGERGEGPDTDR